MSAPSVWRSPYILRRYSGQTYVKGYSTSTFEDRVIQIDIQELNEKQLQNLPEGKRSSKRLKTFGDFELRTANTAEGTPADKLFYDGAWWECEESIYRPHTLLAHCRSQFVMVTESGKEPQPTITTEEEK